MSEGITAAEQAAPEGGCTEGLAKHLQTEAENLVLSTDSQLQSLTANGFYPSIKNDDYI